MQTITAKPVNVTNFENDVIQSNDLVLVDFWAEWCGPCKMIAPVLEEIAVEKVDSVKIVKVNIEEHPDLAQQFGISAIPTLHFFKDGKVTDTLFGMTSKQEIINKVDSLQNKS